MDRFKDWLADAVEILFGLFIIVLISGFLVVAAVFAIKAIL